MMCRICLEEGGTTSVCQCKGSHGQVHLKCIQTWIEHSGADKCELCQAVYDRKVSPTTSTEPSSALQTSTDANICIYTLGIIGAIAHGYTSSLSTETCVFRFLLCFIYNLLHFILWWLLHLQHLTDSIVCLVAWTIVYLFSSSLLQMLQPQGGFQDSSLFGDYVLTVSITSCCVVQSVRKMGEVAARPPAVVVRFNN
jgi:hypothetical protein